eukprot:8139282-Prorocentrum_lima.AAC.1
MSRAHSSSPPLRRPLEMEMAMMWRGPQLLKIPRQQNQPVLVLHEAADKRVTVAEGRQHVQTQ